GRLYLFTRDKEPFYVRLGWRAMDRAEYHGQPVAIMVRMTYIADEYIRRMSTSRMGTSRMSTSRMSTSVVHHRRPAH
ncbi:MAG TPA: hypothetical protein VMY80_11945, partial [Anaerolineae bacterium]|nr:hypothetical protein [Anaerolineae bacterium]